MPQDREPQALPLAQHSLCNRLLEQSQESLPLAQHCESGLLEQSQESLPLAQHCESEPATRAESRGYQHQTRRHEAWHRCQIYMNVRPCGQCWTAYTKLFKQKLSRRSDAYTTKSVRIRSTSSQGRNVVKHTTLQQSDPSAIPPCCLTAENSRPQSDQEGP